MTLPAGMGPTRRADDKLFAEDPSFPRYNRHLNPKGRSKSLAQDERTRLLDSAVYTLTQPSNKDHEELLDPSKYKRVTHTSVQEVHLPVCEEVTVPVVRKEVHKAMEQKVIKGTKLVPITKSRDVKETKLEVRTETVDGRQERRYVPITTVRQVPYTDYEEKEVSMTVEVPTDKVMTRKGHRVDKYVGTKVMAMEQDCVYELRPVLISKSEPRVSKHQRTYLHHGKRNHGDPVWSDDVVEGWSGRPETPPFRHRGNSASSQGSVPGSDRTMSRQMNFSSSDTALLRPQPRS